MHTGIKVIIEHVARHFRLTPREIRSPRKLQAITTARWIGIWLGRTMLRMSYQQLGQAFGGQDHSTVINACRKVWERLAADSAYRETVLRLRDRVAVNIPEIGAVSRSMHLTVRPAPPRLIVEIQGERPIELAACFVTRRVGEGRGDALFGPEPVERTAYGTAWVVVPPELAALWDRLTAPVRSTLSVELAPDHFRVGTITMSPADVKPPPEVMAQLPASAAIRSAHVLAEYEAEQIIPKLRSVMLHNPVEPRLVRAQTMQVFTPADVDRVQADLASALQPFVGQLNTPEVRAEAMKVVGDVLDEHTTIKTLDIKIDLFECKSCSGVTDDDERICAKCRGVV